MENLEAQLDQLERDKLISLIQENQVRIGKYNIRYTKSNKKHSLEHWDACMNSYDRLLRSIPKELLRVEREVRTKFVSTLSPERRTRLLTMINREMEVLFKKMEDLYLEEYRKLHAEEQFQNRLQATRSKCQELLETHMQKCEEALNGETVSEGRLTASEICALYEMSESLLHELNLLVPLQRINNKLESARKLPGLDEPVKQVQEGIRHMARSFREESGRVMESVQERKAHKMQVARETMLFRDLVINLEPLIDQALLPPETRNLEVIDKLWQRLEDYFYQGRREWEPVKTGFRQVYQAAMVQVS